MGRAGAACAAGSSSSAWALACVLPCMSAAVHGASALTWPDYDYTPNSRVAGRRNGPAVQGCPRTACRPQQRRARPSAPCRGGSTRGARRSGRGTAGNGAGPLPVRLCLVGGHGAPLLLPLLSCCHAQPTFQPTKLRLTKRSCAPPRRPASARRRGGRSRERARPTLSSLRFEGRGLQSPCTAA